MRNGPGPEAGPSEKSGPLDDSAALRQRGPQVLMCPGIKRGFFVAIAAPLTETSEEAMFTRVLGKAVAGTAAAALMMVPAATAVSPQLVDHRSGGCGTSGYPSSVATETDLTLDYAAAPYGSKNWAYVDVDSLGAGSPRGQVTLTIEGVRSYTMGLNGAGQAKRPLPRWLKPNTYEITAYYRGKGQCAPSSDNAFYTVMPADTAVSARVLNGKKAKFGAKLVGSGGTRVSDGEAEFFVKDTDGETRRRGSSDVRKGWAAVDLWNLPAGDYSLIVVYRGTSNFNEGGDSVDFQVS